MTRHPPVVRICMVAMTAGVAIGIARPSLAAQTSGATLSATIQSLGAADWQQRSAALERVLALGGTQDVSPKARAAGVVRRHPAEADALTAALVKALVTENRIVATSDDLPEDFSDYYGDLIAAVAAIPDPRTIDALAGALGTGRTAQEALVSFGDAAVEAVLQRLDGRVTPATRLGACAALKTMTSSTAPRPITNPDHQRRVTQALGTPPCAPKP